MKYTLSLIIIIICSFLPEAYVNAATTLSNAGERYLIDGTIVNVTRSNGMGDFGFLLVDTGKRHKDSSIMETDEYDLPIFAVISKVKEFSTLELKNGDHVKLNAVAVMTVVSKNDVVPRVSSSPELLHIGKDQLAEYNYLKGNPDNSLRNNDRFGYWRLQYEFESWDKDFWNKKLAEKRAKEKAKVLSEENALKERAETERQVAQENLRRYEELRRLRAEDEFQAAQTKMRIEEEREKIREQRISDLKSGKMKITNIEDAKLAFNPSNDEKYTYGLPIDGLTKTGEYYIWSGTLSMKSGETYFCLDNYGDRTKTFGFSNVIVRFNEMRENSPVTVVGKLTETDEVTLVNKLSGFKENKTVAVLTDCYVF
ncbi:MAG: hypothetical protein ACLPYB_03625 [Desulfobaccales bacterium]